MNITPKRRLALENSSLLLPLYRTKLVATILQLQTRASLHSYLKKILPLRPIHVYKSAGEQEEPKAMSWNVSLNVKGDAHSAVVVQAALDFGLV